MDLFPTDEQTQILAAVSSFLLKEFPLESHRGKKGRCSELSKEGLKAIADLGWIGLGLDEDRGGVGYTLIEETLLLRELGRNLGPLPVMAGILGARLAAGRDQNLARHIIAGDVKVALARSDNLQCTAAALTGDVQLFGALACDVVLVLTRNLAALIPMSCVSSFTECACLDTTVSMAEGRLANIRPSILAQGDHLDLYRRAIVLTAALQVGVAEAARDMASDYAKVRVQFGKPIGAFQAIRHPCADMAVRCEAAYAQLMFAAICVNDGRVDADFQAAAAAHLAGDAGLKNCRTNIQIHGAMGVTDELAAHLLLKRTHVLEHLFLSPRDQLAAILRAAPPKM